MRSAGTPAATVLTVMTLVFAPMLGHGNNNAQKLVSHTTTTLSVSCPAGLTCPKTARFNEKMSAADGSQAAIEAATTASITRAILDFQAGSHGH